MSVLGFDLEWFDPISCLTQKLSLKFFLDDNTIEILREKSTFLKRICYPEIQLSDLFVGNAITIHNRLYEIKGYANKFTTDFMRQREVRFVSFVSQGDIGLLGRLLNVAQKHGLVAGHIYTQRSGETMVELVGVTSSSCEGFVKAVSGLGGGIEVQRTSAHDIQDILTHSTMAPVSYPATLALIKPHILRQGKAGDMLTYIANHGFTVNALFSTHFSVPIAEELFEAYRGIVSDYSKLIENLCSGPLLAIAIVADDPMDDIVSRFRDFCGPTNPQLAKVLRPSSLRAVFGDSELDNALHCTDLPEDGDMEVRYVFETLANLK